MLFVFLADAFDMGDGVMRHLRDLLKRVALAVFQAKDVPVI